MHLALNAGTKGLLGARFFGAMREGAYFINTARARSSIRRRWPQAIKDRKLRVGLDVYANEPAGGTGPFADPLGQDASVYGTHHIGASTEQAQEAIAAETVRIIQTFKETGNVPNVVNLAQRTPATHRWSCATWTAPACWPRVLDTLRAAEINVQEMENVVFDGAEAAVAHINLDKAPLPAVLERCRAENTNIIELGLLPILPK